MTLDELRSGFFGYQKASVYRYITSLEEQFSSKLVEKDAAAKRAAEQYQERINQLEQELQAVREQCETQKNEQMVIAHTLLDAQRYAEQMKQESAQKQQEAQRCLDEQVAEKNRELERYRSQVQELRKLFLSTEQLTLRDAAGECCLSIDYFSHLFKQCFGISFAAYELNYRLNQAADCMLKKRYSLKEVARIYGFSDKSHFCRSFKKNFGITPGRFSRENAV